jgi:hypothetical protein
MPTRLDLPLVRRLAESFPDEGWSRFAARDLIADRGGQIRSTWRPIAHLDRQGGVYAILLPCVWFHTPRTLRLHASHTHAVVTGRTFLGHSD